MGYLNRFQFVLLFCVLFLGIVLTSCRPAALDEVEVEESNMSDTAVSPVESPTASTAPTAVPTSSAATPLAQETAADLPPIVGIGVLGGSNSDEYRGDDNRGGEYADTTLGWVEQLVKSRHLNFGEWGAWGEPRRTGFAYNWARSGATTREMIETGQHTGLAQQIAAGEVSHALLFIGTNDFSVLNGSYTAVYDGTLDDAQLQAKIDQMTADITTAVDTLLAAGNVKLGIVLVADSGRLPEVQAHFSDQAKRQRVTEAIDAVNAHILALAAQRGILVIDIDQIYSELVAGMDRDGNLDFDGEKINLFSRGDEPHSGQLGDQTGHLGTVLSGYLANVLFVEPFNEAYGLNIRLLTNEEILQNAGIR